MQLLVEQVEKRTAELLRYAYVERTEPAHVRIVRDASVEARKPDFDDSAAAVLEPGGDWREPINSVVWLRFKLQRPEHWPVDETALVAERFGTLPLEFQNRIGL